MRILTVATEAPPVHSGVARAVGRVAEGLAQAGHDVEVVSYADAALWQSDQFRLSALGLSVMRRRLRSFDVVHVHGPAPTVSDLLLLRFRFGRRRPPLVYTHHFTVWVEPTLLAPACRGYDRLTGWLAQAATVIVATTTSYRDHLARAGGAPVEVIPWGADQPPQHRATRESLEGPLRVLLVGQMRRYKGQLVAMEAVRGQPKLQLTLAGGGPLLPQVSALAATAENVTVLTDVDDHQLANLYAGHDVVALPSTNRLEAFGITLLEGMAYGAVPVASDLPGVRDVAGPTGFLVPPGDAAALRACLVRLAGDRELLHERSVASERHAQQLTWGSTVAAYVDLMDRVGASSVPDVRR